MEFRNPSPPMQLGPGSWVPTSNPGAEVIDIGPAVERFGKRLTEFVDFCLRTVERKAVTAFSLHTDTGYARSWIGAELHVQHWTEGGSYGYVGVLHSKHGHGKIPLYPMFWEFGWKRHFVSWYNPNGSERTQFVKWFERHGIKVRRPKSGKLIGGGRMVGPGHNPWMSWGLRASRGPIQFQLRRIEGTL